MNVWHDIKIERITPNKFVAVVEIEKQSKNKYELDKESGLLMLDRILHTSTHYPANYGFIPKTLAEDDDPLDVLVLCSEAIKPLCMVECYPIGVISMSDGGVADDKIIAIPFNDPNWNFYQDLTDLPKHLIEEIMHFFEVYKQLEHKETYVLMTQGKTGAIKIIEESLDRYNKCFNK